MTGSVFILGLLVCGGIMFFWLHRREQARAEKGEPRLATWRILIASFFGLVVLFSGGCSLLFLPDALSGNQYIDPIAVLIIGGIPFAIACFIVWLSLRRGNG
jgi:uncharacterized membrane-anchored protein